MFCAQLDDFSILDQYFGFFLIQRLDEIAVTIGTKLIVRENFGEDLVMNYKKDKSQVFLLLH